MKNERPTFPKRAVVAVGMPHGNKNLHFVHVGGMFVHADIFARYFLRKNTNTRKYKMETVGEFLKKPMLYVPKKYVENAQELTERLPEHRRIDEEKKNSFLFEFQALDHRDKAKAVLDELGIHYTSGKTLVPFRLSGNVEWGVAFPDCEDLRDLTFWVWPESLWAPISFTRAYLRQIGAEENLAKWWGDDEAEVYQFIGEDNIYFYAIAQTGLFTGLQAPRGISSGK